jgi:hypothetical protein
MFIFLRKSATELNEAWDYAAKYNIHKKAAQFFEIESADYADYTDVRLDNFARKFEPVSAVGIF